MRGIQIVCVSPSGATAECDDLVKDLENWFEDHQQMCRLMTTSLSQDAREVASSLDRLRASVDSGQRLLGRLKNSVQNQSTFSAPKQRTTGSIPLSGMNRFDETHTHSTVVAPASAAANSTRSTGANGMHLPNQQNVVTLGAAAANEQPRVLPSRTYLKKSINQG